MVCISILVSSLDVICLLLWLNTYFFFPTLNKIVIFYYCYGPIPNKIVSFKRQGPCLLLLCFFIVSGTTLCPTDSVW